MLYASANGDATTQVDNIQQLASQNPDAHVSCPMGDGHHRSGAGRAAQGIPVVAVRRAAGEDSGAVSTVTRSTSSRGRLCAEWIVKQLGGKGEVAMLCGLAGVPTAEYQKAAAEGVPTSTPTSRSSPSSTPSGRRPWRSRSRAKLVTKYPNIAGIWSDSGYSDVGVVQAYTEAGKPVPP